MNREQEYRALLEELASPPELAGTARRALDRRRGARKARILGVPAGALAACFAAFVLLVNLFPPFAHACGGVPVLRALAQAVAWSPSLSAAVENAYVQPIEQSKTENGITATMEYVIVDQKQVNLFFTLEGRGYKSLQAELPDFSPDQSCSVSSADFGQPPGTLLCLTLDYGDARVPDGFTLTFPVTGERAGEETEEEFFAPEPSAGIAADLMDGSALPQPEILATFTFALSFDPDFTDRGEVIAVNETFTLGGQTLTVTEAEVYPTHLRLNVVGAEENTAWLKGLSFYLENQAGERFEAISNGITATGAEDSPAMVSFRLESPYFSRSDRLSVYITAATWLDKDRVWAEVDLAAERASGLPDGVALHGARREGNGWLVEFSAPREPDGAYYQIFDLRYRDAAGTVFYGDTRACGDDPVLWDTPQEAEGEPGRFYEVFPLRDYPEERVWLAALFTRETAAEAPVVISLR